MAQTKVRDCHYGGSENLSDPEWVEGVGQKRGSQNDSQGLGLSNLKDRVAINQDEKCLDGVDLGDETKNSLFAMLSLRRLLDKQSLELEREGLKKRRI